MANNNYQNLAYAGTQFNANYNAAAAQVSYPAVTNATYANAAAYQSAAVAGQAAGYGVAGTSAGAAAAGYGNYADYGGGARALQSYDTSKAFYQAASNYTAAPAATSKTHYSAPPVKNAAAAGKSAAAAGKDKNTLLPAAAGTTTTTAAGAAVAANSYGNYDNAALYSAGSGAGGYAATPQHSHNSAKGNWTQYRNVKNVRSKPPPRPQQLHYCEVCKISCAGPQTYREHLDGQKHKKREALLKMQASAQTTSQNRGNNYHCELCDVTCTGTDAYAAHVRGAKHQKVVKLHQKLGKPIPSDDPKKLAKINFVPASGDTAATSSLAPGEQQAEGAASAIKTEQQSAEHKAEELNASTEDSDNIKPVGAEYIEEIKDEEGKIISFNCKLCDCKFNDPNAQEMHMKGRRHRLQYKRKVQPDLVVDFKPTPRQRRMAEARAQRAIMQYRNSNNVAGNMDDHHDAAGGVGGAGMYWNEQRRRPHFDDEYEYNWMRGFGGAAAAAAQQRGYGGIGRNGNAFPPFFNMMPGGAAGAAANRRPESSDDRHAIARHAEIYPKEQELQVIQRIVSHTERALKYVSDALTETAAEFKKDKNAAAAAAAGAQQQQQDGRDNQMLSFQAVDDTAAGNVRILKGVMRVGFLAKGLLLQGDNAVELVVLCSEKPTIGILKLVADELPGKLKEVLGEQDIDYHVDVCTEDSALLVTDDAVSVKITLTSPLFRELPDKDANHKNVVANVASSSAANEATKTEQMHVDDEAADAAFLPKEPCLKALAELRHAKWFQARATNLQSCVMVIRILRDLCQREPTWQALPQWSLELLVEKVISSAGMSISPGDCMRRIMEALASGFLINGPGLLDPCEKEAVDALHTLSKQQREDLTVSAQKFLRFIAFRQIHKVLGMEQIPPFKFPLRPWRLTRKRRRSPSKSTAAAVDADNDAGGCSEEKNSRKEPPSSNSNTNTAAGAGGGGAAVAAAAAT